MRIIAGKFKGRKLNFISDEKTRPTADVVREALFTKIQFDVPDCTFLDLFAGSGAVGLEALSRGAKEVVFVDNNKKNIDIIKSNLKLLYGEEVLSNQKVQIIFNNFLPALSNLFIKFDFVYIDPPYKSELYTTSMSKLVENDLLKDDAIIICEHLSTESKNFIDFPNYTLLTQKKYGIKTLSYFSWHA